VIATRSRALAATGGALLIGSVFLPRPGIGSLAGELVSWNEALQLTLEAEGAPLSEIVPLVGIVMALAYLPLCGLLALLTALVPATAWRGAVAAPVLILHTLFQGMLTFLGFAGIVTDDQWMPGALYWVIAIGGVIVMAATWLAFFTSSVAARLPRIQVPVLVIFALGLGGAAAWLLSQERHAWSPWGLAASALGAAIASVALLGLRNRDHE
jgi:pimeloyl-ACP methyl ester carboxylesterase